MWQSVGELTLEVVLGWWEWAVDSELDYRLVQKARDTEEGNVRKMGKSLLVGVGHFMAKKSGKQLAKEVSKGDSLDIEIMLKLGRDCREMAFVGQGDKSMSDYWVVGARQREVKLRMMKK